MALTTNIDNQVATLTFDRPKALNALNIETIKALDVAIDEIAGNKKIGIVVLRGAGEKAFVAGADIKEMSSLSPLQASEFAGLGQQVCLKLEAAPQICIAAVDGFALGGGCEISMACDLIYASDKAKFGQPEVNLGVIAGFGGTQRLARLVGPMKARELLLTGNMIDAAEAKRIGLVADVFEAATFEEKISKIVALLLAKGPEALVRTKRAQRDGAALSVAQGCALEREHFGMCFSSPQREEGMQAFLEKRPAQFRSTT